MSTIEKQNTLLLLPIKALNKKKFVIGNYQRGYKWGKKEILELLNDINEYESTKGIYCIQPIILKPVDEVIEKIEVEGIEQSVFVNNEVIDGQQRTTTIFILLKYLNHIGALTSDYNYEIDFKVREKSREFLKNKLDGFFGGLPLIDEVIEMKNYLDLSDVNANWALWITENQRYDTVDVYHFFVVSSYIKTWFAKVMANDTHKTESFISKLLNKIHIIWYSLDSSIDDGKVVDVFLNNNKGKISLTTSELIKALFILDISNKESKAIGDYKINRFALEWDQIEKKLQDDTFWYFLQSDTNKYIKGTRIDFLFDLLLDRMNNEDESFAYRYYEKLFNSKRKDSDFENEWNKIIHLFNKLIDWYNDPVLYHITGFLTVTGIKNLFKIVKESAKKNKNELKEFLKGTIKDQFNKTSMRDNVPMKPYEIETLSYDGFYKQTKHVLLLYNVVYYIEKMSKHKFPFELYVKEKWSIEHIVPQNPKDFEDFEDYKNWFRDQVAYQEGSRAMERKDERLLKLYEMKNFDELKKDIEFFKEIEKIIESFEDRTHGISNLLLLDRNTNSALGNKLFKDKRKKILHFDRTGISTNGEPVFIPIETLNAFNRTFSNDIEISQWSSEDGEKYKESISERLNEFLPVSL